MTSLIVPHVAHTPQPLTVPHVAHTSQALTVTHVAHTSQTALTVTHVAHTSQALTVPHVAHTPQARVSGLTSSVVVSTMFAQFFSGGLVWFTCGGYSVF